MENFNTYNLIMLYIYDIYTFNFKDNKKYYSKLNSDLLE
jgi:hypothetical protein